MTSWAGKPFRRGSATSAIPDLVEDRPRARSFSEKRRTQVRSINRKKTPAAEGLLRAFF